MTKHIKALSASLAGVLAAVICAHVFQGVDETALAEYLTPVIAAALGYVGAHFAKNKGDSDPEDNDDA